MTTVYALVNESPDNRIEGTHSALVVVNRTGVAGQAPDPDEFTEQQAPPIGPQQAIFEDEQTARNHLAVCRATGNDHIALYEFEAERLAIEEV